MWECKGQTVRVVWASCCDCCFFVRYYDLTPGLLEKILQEQLDRQEMGKQNSELIEEGNDKEEKKYEDLSDEEKFQVIDNALDSDGEVLIFGRKLFCLKFSTTALALRSVHRYLFLCGPQLSLGG